MSSCRQPLRVAALSALAAPILFAHAAGAQSFAVGAGASLVNDTGSVERPSAFSTWGGHVFGELELEKGVVLQLRVSRFSLPGTVLAAPNLKAEAATVSVAYLFRERWWAAGLFAGAGYYRLTPKDLEPGQISVDEKESTFGWNGGVLTSFDIAPNWDLRLELSGHVIRSNVQHKPIMIGTSIAYHF